MKTFLDLYKFLKHHDTKTIIPWLRDPWKGKDKQESLLRLFAGLGVLQNTQSYLACNGNFNMQTITPMRTYRDVFYKKSGELRFLNDKGDSSDFTGIHKKNKKHLLVTTSKNLTKTNIGGLDISGIITNFQQYKYSGYTMTLCVCIRDKSEYTIMKKRVEKTSKELSSYLDMDDTIVIDWGDLNHAYKQFGYTFQSVSLDTIIQSNKETLCLKMHQRLGVLKTIRMKEDKSVCRILWGHIQRSGKSYIIGGCIIADGSPKTTCNYLIVTTAPNETIVQQKHVLDCLQLSEFNTVVLSSKNKTPVLTQKNIIICSKQFLQSKLGGTKTISWLNDMTFDMRFIDESHNGGTTSLAKKTLAMYGCGSFTVQITATYSKPVHDYDIPTDNWVLWDLEDIRICKHITDQSRERLIEKHGDEMSAVLSNHSNEYIISEYKSFPELWVLTDRIHNDYIEEIQQKTSQNKYGWSTEACFLLKQGVTHSSSDKSKCITIIPEFQKESEALKVWYRIFGRYDTYGIPHRDYPDEDVFLKRIEHICKHPGIKSRYIGCDELHNEPMVIMAFLPQNNIDILSTATVNLFEEYSVVPDYEVLCINGKRTSDPKQAIEDARVRARLGGKKGVLVLSGKQCTLGVSIDYCDIVLLLNHTNSFDMVYQMMFRCMTEGDGKTCGFVVDMNIQRVIETTLIPYASIIKPIVHPKESVRYLLQERLLNLNGDHWMGCFSNTPDTVDKKIEMICDTVYDMYSSNTVGALTQMLRRINLKDVSLTSSEQLSLNKMFGKKPRSKRDPQLMDLSSQSDELKYINNGIETKKIVSQIDNTVEDDIKTDDTIVDEKRIDYTDALKHMIPLICLLTIHHEQTSFQAMFRIITNNVQLYTILVHQLKSWWGKGVDTETIRIFLMVYTKHIETDTEIGQIVRTVKELFLVNLKNNQGLSRLIDTYLIPQELERKQNAEVSTPFDVRKQMLDMIPCDFWESKQTVLEPCSGKGGFLVDIIDRFMVGLKTTIPNELERYKIIVEKCIFFGDVNPTNIFICKLLIDPNNNYSLNYNQGNTLELDSGVEWGVDGFDAVIGNPPYQPPSNNKKGGKSIWGDFVKYSLGKCLKQNGLLLFVHPALWRKPGNSLGKQMFLNQIHQVTIHNKIEGGKVFGATTRYDCYLLERTPPVKKTKIVFEDKNVHEIMLGPEQGNVFLPNFGWSVIEKVMSKLKNNGIQVIGDSDCHTMRPHVSKTKQDGYTHILLNSISKTKGKTYRYSNRPHKHQTSQKVLFSNGEQIVPFYDNGNMGTTQGGLYILVNGEEEGLQLVTYLQTELVSFIIRATKWSNFETTKQLFSYIPNIIGEVGDITNNSVYEYFNITDDEISQIER
jgi:hypothetical protein